MIKIERAISRSNYEAALAGDQLIDFDKKL